MALTDDLISYWKLDEASGDALDAHGSNDLTETSGTIGSATGRVGNARDFEAGDTEYFEIASNAELQTGDIDFTFAAWVNLESIDILAIAAKGWNAPGADDANREWVIFYNNSTSRVEAQIGHSGASLASFAASDFGILSTSQWYFVEFWHNSVDDEVGLSVNGVETVAAHSTGVNAGTNPFRIGALPTQNVWWDGLIDEVGFWKRVLTPFERSMLYRNGFGLAYPFTESMDNRRTGQFRNVCGLGLGMHI